MRTNYKIRSFFAPDFPLKQLCARCLGLVRESGIRGNHAGVAPVSRDMIPRSMQGGRVTRSLPWWGRRFRPLSGCLLLLCLSLPHALPAADRITVAIDNSRRATLPGHVSPRIESGVDQGSVDPSMDLPYVTLMLKPSASQQADLDRLLAQQQDPSSPDYHNWLTPEQYADRFGLSQADIAKMVAWLGQHGLAVKSIARGRNAIAFGGTAGQIGSAFGVEIHRYQVGGVPHYSNSTDPTIPVALQGVVLAIRGLHDFRLKPHLKPMSRPNAHPWDTQNRVHYLAPDDVATIYDITPLYNAGISGTGQNLAIVGQTDIQLSDIAYFRSYFSLPAKDPTVILIPGSPDPGLQVSSGDLVESDLDLELSGAVARNATILFVTSTNVEDSLQYAIDQNLAPVISTSYGDCELDTGSALAQGLASIASQANAQGQTLFAASGDYGAADCFGLPDLPSIDNAASVDLPAALPQVTGIGGTEFNEGSNPGEYWNSNNTATHASARSYIPEIAWNDSVAQGQPAASGGGVSVFFAKPLWQTGTGFLSGGRNVPDVSLSASNSQDVYEVYTVDPNTGVSDFQGYGGTSVGSPQFAGIAVLLSQYLVANGSQATAPLGNINPTLYALAPVAGVFHDIATGSNIVLPCQGCTGVGYNAGPGYDQVTGLGTPDVFNLVTAWHAHSVASPQSVTMTLTASPVSVAFTGATVLTATVTSANGATPTGTVAFAVGTSPLGTATLSGSGSSATATLTLSGGQLAVGANAITATYSGNAAYYGEIASASVAETTPSSDQPSIGGVSDGASFKASIAAGGILSIFGTQLAPTTATAQTVPLPTMLAGTTVTFNGVPAPLYFVSPKQLNVQIPYEVVSSGVSLMVDDNGVSAFDIVDVADMAPAIFAINSQGTGQGSILDNATYKLVDASHPATPGSTYIQIYCIGLGAVTNQPADGAASPSSPSFAETSAPAQVTIGGVQENAVFTGLAPGFVGLYQVNALVPAGVKATGGSADVVISIGGASSNTVTIAVGP